MLEARSETNDSWNIRQAGAQSKSCLSDSCSSRSGLSLMNPSSMSSNNFIRSPCFCDNDCPEYRDCCNDEFKKSKSINIAPANQWDCILLPGTTSYVYAISSCPVNWPGKVTASLCKRKLVNQEAYSYLLDVPVIARENKRFYSNMHCAECHGKTQLENVTLRIKGRFEKKPDVWPEDMKYVPGKHMWKSDRRFNGRFETLKLGIPEYMNWENLLNKYSPRRCKSVTDRCPEEYGNAEIAENCEAYASYVALSEEHIVGYKNKFCIQTVS